MSITNRINQTNLRPKNGSSIYIRDVTSDMPGTSSLSPRLNNQLVNLRKKPPALTFPRASQFELQPRIDTSQTFVRPSPGPRVNPTSATKVQLPLHSSLSWGKCRCPKWGFPQLIGHEVEGKWRRQRGDDKLTKLSQSESNKRGRLETAQAAAHRIVNFFSSLQSINSIVKTEAMAAQELTPKDFQNAFHWAASQKDGTIPSFATRPNDPYTYQPGFGNSFESEAIPGTIPRGQNSPRSIRYGLYAEQITGSAFVAPRHANKKAWLYRSRPAVAHQGFVSAP